LVQRLIEIVTEIKRTGTYTLTTDELQFGAKTAWRNTARCIGRIQWNKLELQDARHVQNTKQMFDTICKHIQFATNGGNIRYQ
jgi:nitric oxide synthase oxygenase domain/subunit